MKNTAQTLLLVFFATLVASCNPDSNPASGSDSSANTPSPSAQSRASSCATCGTVTAINPVTAKGQGSGAGAVIGAVVGGLLGHQVGDGSEQDAATAVGAIGGAVAGNEIEKRSKATTYYAVTVNLEQGGQRTVNVANPQGISVGTKVKIVGNDLHVLRQ